MARRKAPRVGNNTRYYTLTRLLGAPSPLYSDERERHDGLPGAANNTGEDACLARSGQARRALRWLSLSVIPGREQSERARNPYAAALRIMDSGFAG